MQETEILKLHLIEGSDAVDPTPINQNMEALETETQAIRTALGAAIDGLTAAGALCHFAQGSYTGTGKYGSSSPNTLTFRFPPKLLFLFPSSAVTEANYNFDTVYGVGLAEAGRLFSIGSACTFSVSGNTASWYHEGGNGYQFNLPAKYYYIALG